VDVKGELLADGKIQLSKLPNFLSADRLKYLKLNHQSQKKLETDIVNESINSPAPSQLQLQFINSHKKLPRYTPWWRLG
jgi:hypothetical protein